MMDSIEALGILAQHRTNQVVIATMTSSHVWDRLSDHALDLPLKSCMGKASSLGLGIALARPDVPVWVLDGDGSLLNNLGTLITIGNLAPANFHHFLLNNGVYRASGSQPLPGVGKVAFCTLAESAGYAASFSFDDPKDLRHRLPDVIRTLGPALICLNTEPCKERIGHLRKGSTRDALLRVKAALDRGISPHDS
jgi:phosphonopyruvate decarboxylase